MYLFLWYSLDLKKQATVFNRMQPNLVLSDDASDGMNKEERYMITVESIRYWTRNHTEEETLELLGNGEVIYFQCENLSTSDCMALTVIQTAYIYFEIERERRSERAKALYYSRVKSGEYIPRTYLGYHPQTFIPDEMSAVVRLIFEAAASGVSCTELADLLNEAGLLTTRANPFTARAVRSILRNPVYCGDVVFRQARRTIRDHHTAIVDRELWERVQTILSKCSALDGKGTAKTTAEPVAKEVVEVAA